MSSAATAPAEEEEGQGQATPTTAVVATATTTTTTTSRRRVSRASQHVDVCGFLYRAILLSPVALFFQKATLVFAERESQESCSRICTRRRTGTSSLFHSS